jgi:hypothetical protein
MAAIAAIVPKVIPPTAAVAAADPAAVPPAEVVAGALPVASDPVVDSVDEGASSSAAENCGIKAIIDAVRAAKILFEKLFIC